MVERNGRAGVPLAVGLLASASCTPAGVGPLIFDAASPDTASTVPPNPYACNVDGQGVEAILGDASTEDAADSQGVGDPENGRLAGITAAHNRVRAAVQTQPPLDPLTWCQTIGDYAQQWATTLAANMCSQPQHRSAVELQARGYGENLATFGSGGLLGPISTTAQQAVSSWAAEAQCWSYGTVGGTDKCDAACYANLHSDGCGHYTQMVWRDTTQLGCGVATCKNGGVTEDIWVCNYAPPGNFPGQAPY